MLIIKFRREINGSKEYEYSNAVARIIGSRIVVEEKGECVVITEFGNVEELIKVE